MQYKLSNQLGNVLTTVSSKPRLMYDENDDFLYKESDVTTVSDYYPFGMLAPGRHWQSDGYRYHFNGKSFDNEGLGGGGSTYDYGFRIFNAQIGRFLSVDPLDLKFPFYTPYQFSGNTPISCIDLDGLQAISVIVRTSQQDPALKQVTISKIKSKIEQQNLTVEYRYIDQNGQITSEFTSDSYAQGSIEAKLANLSFRGGSATYEDVLTAGTNNGNNFIANTLQDPQSIVSGGTTRILSCTGFQYDLNIEYKPDGFRINSEDLKPGTLADAQMQIMRAQSTLNGVVQAINPFTGSSFSANLSAFDITVVGETDGMSSNHIPNTQPNNMPSGNPALAQDRANVLKSSLGNMSGRSIKTQIVNHSGGENQQNRSAKIYATP